MVSINPWQREKLTKIALNEITIDIEVIIQAVADNFNPEDIFKTNELEQWAEDNGFTKN